MTASLFSADLLSLLSEGKHNEDVKAIIARETLQSKVDHLGNNLLHYAANCNNVAIMQYLLDSSGINIDAQNNLGKTPLMLAVENNCCDATEILIKAGANVLIEDKLKNNVLENFRISNSLCRKSNVMGILLNNCDIAKIADRLKEDGWSLPRVIFFRNARLTKLMLDLGYLDNINERDDEFDDATALHIAMQSVDVENARVLLSHNADIEVEDDCNLTPIAYLYGICGDISEDANERLEILKMFIESEQGQRKITNSLEIDGDIEFLLQHGSKEAVKLLIEAGLNLDSEEEDLPHGSVVHLLLRNVNPGVIEQLRGKTFDVNMRNNLMRTPLIIAASGGMPKAVEFLIDEGADMDAIDFNKKSALSEALACCDESKEMQYRDCLQILLERGANAQLVLSSYYRNKETKERTILDQILECKSFQRGELVLSHLALQQALGTSIKQLLRDTINSDERLREKFESSERELKIQVHPSTTLLDLLTATEKTFERYVRDPELHSNLKAFIEKCDFHYFKTILEKRLAKADVKAKAVRIICRFTRTDYERFPLVAQEIVSYLEQKDIENLVCSISEE